MESHILKHAQERVEFFRPNAKLDALIEQLRRLVAPAQQLVNDEFSVPKYPVVVVVGCPRSGTTFLTQLLAATGAFAYPSNLIARFAYAPHIGALIQQLLLNPEYDLGNEFSDLRSGSNFASNVGKTSGALGINEFFHFWRRFFPHHDPGHLEEGELESVKIGQMRQELASIQAVFGAPFMSKGMMLQYNLAHFAKAMPELKIVHVKRDPLYLMQSVTQARLKYYGTDKIWWSVKPKEYSFLKDSEPATQVAGQVLFTDQAIQSQIKDLPTNRWITACYESVCKDPRKFLKELAERFDIPDVANDMTLVAQEYQSGNTRRINNDGWALLRAEYEKLGGNLSGACVK